MKLALLAMTTLLAGMAAAMPFSDTTLSRRDECVPKVDEITGLFSLKKDGGECADTKASQGIEKKGPGPIGGIDFDKFGGRCSKAIIGKYGCDAEAAKGDKNGTPSKIYVCTDTKDDGPNWVVALDSCSIMNPTNMEGATNLKDMDAKDSRFMCAGMGDKQDKPCCGVWKGDKSKAQCFSWDTAPGTTGSAPASSATMAR